MGSEWSPHILWPAQCAHAQTSLRYIPTFVPYLLFEGHPRVPEVRMDRWMGRMVGRVVVESLLARCCVALGLPPPFSRTHSDARDLFLHLIVVSSYHKRNFSQMMRACVGTGSCCFAVAGRVQRVGVLYWSALCYASKKKQFVHLHWSLVQY